MVGPAREGAASEVQKARTVGCEAGLLPASLLQGPPRCSSQSRCSSALGRGWPAHVKHMLNLRPVRDRRQRDTRLEQEEPSEVESPPIVKEVLEAAACDHLGHDDRRDAVLLTGDPSDAVENRIGELAEWALDNLERDRQTTPLPFAAHVVRASRT